MKAGGIPCGSLVCFVGFCGLLCWGSGFSCAFSYINQTVFKLQSVEGFIGMAMQQLSGGNMAGLPAMILPAEAVRYRRRG
jgi:hypothetical protein